MENKSIEELQVLASQNNSEAIYELGNRYCLGKDIERDYEKAITNFKEAINLGNEKGKYGMAKCYYYGKGVEKDYEKAYNIFKELSEKGDQDAKYFIAKMYYYGKGIKQNYKKAYNIFKELSEKGDQYAKYYIAEMYYLGKGIEQNYKKAYNIFKELSEKGDQFAKYYIAEMYYYGKGVEKNYEKAYNIFKELAEKGYQGAKYYIATMYYYGKYVDKNYEKAKYYFEKSLNEEIDDSYYYLYLINENGGYGVTKNTDESEKYLFKIEKDLCECLIYYSITMDKNKLEDYLEFLNYDKEFLDALIKGFPIDHPISIYYNRLKSLNSEQYKEIAQKLKEKINIFYAREIKYFTIKNVTCEEDVDILAEIIIASSKYNTMNEYFSKKVDEDKDERILYAIGKTIYYGQGYDRDTKMGLELLKISAEKGYPLAKKKLAEINPENK